MPSRIRRTAVKDSWRVRFATRMAVCRGERPHKGRTGSIPPNNTPETRRNRDTSSLHAVKVSILADINMIEDRGDGGEY